MKRPRYFESFKESLDPFLRNYPKNLQNCYSIIFGTTLGIILPNCRGLCLNRIQGFNFYPNTEKETSKNHAHGHRGPINVANIL